MYSYPWEIDKSWGMLVGDEIKYIRHQKRCWLNPIWTFIIYLKKKKSFMVRVFF